MPAVQREGDLNAGGGIIIGGGVTSVKINGKPAATPGLLVAPHFPCGPKAPQHCIALTTGGARGVKVAGKPLLLTGNKDTCGHGRVGGSPNVKAR